MGGDHTASAIAEVVAVGAGSHIGGLAAVGCTAGADCTAAETLPATADTLAAEVRNCCSRERQASNHRDCRLADHLC